MSVLTRWARLAAPALATGSVLGASALALAAPAGAVGVVSKPVGRLYVVEHAKTDTEVPSAPGGTDEKGDPLTFTNPIFNYSDTKQVGHDAGFCMRLNVAAGSWECLWTTFVPGGSIMVQGPYYDHRNSTLTITGGTGRYNGVEGSMFLKSRDGGKQYDFDFDLRTA